MFGRKRIVTLLSTAALTAGLVFAAVPAHAAAWAGAFTFTNRVLNPFPCATGGALQVPRVNPQTTRFFGCGPTTFTGTYHGTTPDGTTFVTATLTVTFRYTEPCVAGESLAGAASGTILVNGAVHGFKAFDWLRVGTQADITVGTTGSGGVGQADFVPLPPIRTCAAPGAQTVDIVGTAAGA